MGMEFSLLAAPKEIILLAAGRLTHLYACAHQHAMIAEERIEVPKLA
jgi:hypothetical protein